MQKFRINFANAFHTRIQKWDQKGRVKDNDRHLMVVPSIAPKAENVAQRVVAFVPGAPFDLA